MKRSTLHAILFIVCGGLLFIDSNKGESQNVIAGIVDSFFSAMLITGMIFFFAGFIFFRRDEKKIKVKKKKIARSMFQTNLEAYLHFKSELEKIANEEGVDINQLVRTADHIHEKRRDEFWENVRSLSRKMNTSWRLYHQHEKKT